MFLLWKQHSTILFNLELRGQRGGLSRRRVGGGSSGRLAGSVAKETTQTRRGRRGSGGTRRRNGLPGDRPSGNHRLLLPDGKAMEAAFRKVPLMLVPADTRAPLLYGAAASTRVR